MIEVIDVKDVESKPTEEVEFVGTHKPTDEVPHLFVYPKTESCRLLANGEHSPEHGCPCHPNSSCSHGYEGFVCEHAIDDTSIK